MELLGQAVPEWLYLERLLLRLIFLRPHSHAQIFVNGFFQGLTGSTEALLQLRLHVVVKSKCGSHITMLSSEAS